MNIGRAEKGYLFGFWWLGFSIFFVCFIPLIISLIFIWGVIYFCTMDGFFRILKKISSKLICTRPYIEICAYFFATWWFFQIQKPYVGAAGRYDRWMKQIPYDWWPEQFWHLNKFPPAMFVWSYKLQTVEVPKKYQCISRLNIKLGGLQLRSLR